MAKNGSQLFGSVANGQSGLVKTRKPSSPKAAPEGYSHIAEGPLPTDPQIKKQIGQSIRAIREKAGITQELAAERADLHPIYYGNVERGRNNISVISLARIARALKCSVRDIIAGTDL